ncbi:MAG TPA: outer membrane lipoprotein-sorting protein, partial [Myxococcales bacterium]
MSGTRAFREVTRAALAAGVLAFAATAAAQTPEEKGMAIAVAAHKANGGWGTERSTLTMLLVSAQGDQTTRKLGIDTQEGTTDGDKSRVTFDWPADVKGTRLLTWSHKDGNDDQWLYLPAIKRVKRISSSDKSGSFMGSEVAYEDLGSQEPEKYKYKLLGEAKE